MTAAVVIGRRPARRLRTARTIARVRTVARANTTKRVRVRLPGRIRAKLARARTLRATVTWRAVDDFGNRAKLTRRVRLRR